MVVEETRQIRERKKKNLAAATRASRDQLNVVFVLRFEFFRNQNALQASLTRSAELFWADDDPVSALDSTTAA